MTPRVVSLLPSGTEIVCAVGAESALVGVSHECDWPPSVVGLPVLTSSRLGPVGASGEVDRDVRRLLQDALAIYAIDERALAAARPDVIVTQDLCEVCAVSFDDVVGAVQRLAQADVQLVNLHPTRLAHIWDDVRRVGQALGHAAGAETLLAGMDRRVEEVRRRAADADARPAVLTLEWIDPVMVGGTWMPELVELAGGRPLVTEAGEPAPTLSAEALAALDPAPDVVLVKPCGFPIERTLGERDALAALLPASWPAVTAGQVWVADGSAYFNRSGPRIVDSLEILAAILHPGSFADLGRPHAAAFQRLAL